jgi:hypothetical protein
LGVPQREGSGVPAHGVHPADGQKAMPRLAMFPDRLSGIVLHLFQRAAGQSRFTHELLQEELLTG